MEWHYSVNGEAVGPVGEDEVKQLIAQGTVNAETMVWNSTFDDWQPLGNTELSSLLSNSGPVPVVDVNGVQCSICGNTFSDNEIVDIGGVKSCAECKPLALKRFQENSAVSTDMRYAGFWIRVCSTIVDGVILSLFNWLILFLVAQLPSMIAVSPVIQILTGFLYTTVLIWKYGATLGLMAVKLKVVNADGSNVSYLKSVGRYFGYLLSSITFGVGFIMVAFDREKRALHDMICGTRVIYKDK